jgi:3-hydroxyisobutyrate dehydrogenase-like beta-hydroxyacid dehydrogenase
MVLALAAARELKSPSSLAAFAEELYRPLAQAGSGYDGLDFSVMYRHLEESA